MNYFDLYSSYPDRTIAAAWDSQDSQVKEADKTPWLAEALTECVGELFTRFAACYAELGRRRLAALAVALAGDCWLNFVSSRWRTFNKFLSLNERLCGPPRNVGECRSGNWMNFTFPRVFENQGDCQQYVITGSNR